MNALRDSKTTKNVNRHVEHLDSRIAPTAMRLRRPWPPRSGSKRARSADGKPRLRVHDAGSHQQQVLD